MCALPPICNHVMSPPSHQGKDHLIIIRTCSVEDHQLIIIIKITLIILIIKKITLSARRHLLLRTSPPAVFGPVVRRPSSVVWLQIINVILNVCVY